MSYTALRCSESLTAATGGVLHNLPFGTHAIEHGDEGRDGRNLFQDIKQFMVGVKALPLHS